MTASVATQIHEPTPHEVALSYLKSIPLEGRRQAGQVYTPLHLVDFVLESAGFNPDHPIELASVLDPACGGGIFLEAAVMLLAARLTSQGRDLSTPVDRRAFLELVSSNFFGIDVDPHACTLTRQAVRAAVARVAPGELPEDYFLNNVLEADFLLSDELEMWLPFGGMTFIVGNPPYVQTTRLETTTKEALRSRFKTATGRLDLYTLFIERSIPLLAGSGRLAFITPDKFLASLSADLLRRLMLRHGSPVTIARFKSHKIFEDAATVPCVTVFEHNASPAEVRVLECEDHPSTAGEVVIERQFQLPATILQAQTWDLSPPDLSAVAARVQGRHPTLENLTERISAGIATGKNDVFVVTPEKAKGLDQALLRPAIRGSDLDAFTISDPHLYLLIPYTFEGSADGGRKLIDLDQYPRTRDYLLPHRAELEQRQCVTVKNQPWYAYTDPSKSDLSTIAKILVPDIAEHNRFVYDPGNYFPLNSAYYLVPKNVDPLLLTAVLNSTPIEFLIRLRAPIAKDRFSRYRRQFLAPLPIPQASLEQQEAILEAARAGDYRKSDRLCTALFELTNDDLLVINAFLGR